MAEDLISVIVPVYKVEEYLRECVDSILAQTYTNLEIILVDDGSPDNCGKICDEYAKKDSRIKVIHQQNGGLSAARNTGLDIATGDYIGFVDSDDYIELNMFEELHNSIKEYNSDMSVCGVKKFELDSRSFFYGKKCVSKNTFMMELLKETIASYSWNKLYKKELFVGIRFPVGELFEDIKIMHFIGEKTNRVSFTDKTHYNYRIRENSITADNKGIKAKDYLSATHSRCERYKKTEYYVCAIAGEFKCLRVIVSDMSEFDSKSDEYKKLRLKSKELYSICKREIKGFQKILSWLYLISPRIYAIIKKLYLSV